MALITVHLKRTAEAVRAALPEDELADFDADMASTPTTIRSGPSTGGSHAPF